MRGNEVTQYLYTYMVSSPTRHGRQRYLKLGHGTDPRRRMKDYTDAHTYNDIQYSVRGIILKFKHEIKPIKGSLKTWPIRADVAGAKKVEEFFGWYLHERLGLTNIYLSVVELQQAGQLPARYRLTADGELIWTGAKELYELGPASKNRAEAENGPTAKYNRAVVEIERILRARLVLDTAALGETDW